MVKKEGQVTVSSENIFPVIRQWLYADRDIFLRELVANAQDALQKLDHLELIGEFERKDEEIGVQIFWDDKQRILTIEDDGIGMTLEEVDKYINDIAFSGALDFVHKYEEDGVAGEGIIGHFGLGFYSAFMVSDHVQIDTLSYKEDSEPARWVSEDGLHYEMSTPEEDDPLRRATHGTEVRLHIPEDDDLDLSLGKIRKILRKYCYFMAKPIYLMSADSSAEDQEDKDNKDSSEGSKDSSEESKDGKALEKKKPVNNTHPLWLETPSEVEDQDYIDFYHECFTDSRDPMFWIHLNMDYPYRLQGILYFPQKEFQIERLDGRIQLYSNQVFVTDSLRDLIPEFLFLLKGTLDCPDLPLNVSRSYLQDDRVLGRLSDHIVRKVADKLKELEKNDRDFYEESWPAIEYFARYGYLTEEKFAKRVEPVLLFEKVQGGFYSQKELDKEVYYTTDPEAQAAYVKRQEKRGAQVIVMRDEISTAVMQKMMLKSGGEQQFFRVDAKIEGEEGKLDNLDKLEALFQDLIAAKDTKVEVRALGDELPLYLLEDEQNRSIREMQERYAQINPDMKTVDVPAKYTVVLNSDHALIQKMAESITDEPSEKLRGLGRHLLDLALLAKGELEADDLLNYLQRSADYLAELV